jgi:hypothetical protein
MRLLFNLGVVLMATGAVPVAVAGERQQLTLVATHEAARKAQREPLIETIWGMMTPDDAWRLLGDARPTAQQQPAPEDVSP